MLGSTIHTEKQGLAPHRKDQVIVEDTLAAYLYFALGEIDPADFAQ